MDIATGWEEGGLTRVYRHPGPGRVRERWPRVTVGRTVSVEDAVFADLDGDGRQDVVSCCEGRTRTVFVHWAPRGALGEGGSEGAWEQAVPGPTAGRMAFMFCLPMQVDGRGGIDLVIGAKNAGAEIGWLQSPEEARDAGAWRWHTISPAGWIMSLIAADMDGDGDADVVTTDRKGPMRGCRWLENPGPVAAAGPWVNHFVGGQEWEVLFMRLGDVNGDGRPEAVVAARRPGRSAVLMFERQDARGRRWTEREIAWPVGAGVAKAVAVGDIDGDGHNDLVISCESAQAPRSGVMWLRGNGTIEGAWTAHDVSGPTGIKFDRIELIDLDEDGDLDILTCEEREPDDQGRSRGLGVIWYENPQAGPKADRLRES